MGPDQVEKLEWIPLYVHRLKGSRAYRHPGPENPQGLWDFQFGWYMKLIVESIDSDNPGFLPNDIERLWQLAGAKTKRYFLRESVSVLAYFPGRTADGRWMYNPRLLQVLREQLKKKGKLPKEESANLFINDLSLSSSKEVVFNLYNPEELKASIHRVFDFYQATFRRDKRYKLTPERTKKCELRMLELMKEGGTLEDAEAAAKEAVSNLSQLEWNVENGFVDWVDQLFLSRERFEKMLASKPRPIARSERELREMRIRAEMQVGKRYEAGDLVTPDKGHVLCVACGKDLGPALPTDDPEEKFICDAACRDLALRKGIQ